MAIPLMAGPLLGQGPALGAAPQDAPGSALAIEVDEATGKVRVREAGAAPAPAKTRRFDDNLAALLDESALGAIAELLLRGIEADERSRREMLEQYTRGMDLLGLRLEGDAAGFAAGQGGKTISRVRHPILLWACVRFQAGARNELLPSAGPVKVRLDADDDSAADALAKDFERDFNHYLTVTASEYYPDTDRGLFYLAYGGTLFKKVYRCPLRERPVAECVYMPDLIVSNDATDLANAQRVTHRFEMAPATVERLMAAGFYRDIDLPPPSESTVDPAKRKEAEIAGVAPEREQPQDKQHTIDECYAALDLAPFGYREAGARPGEALPYRVSIDRDSRRILEIRRNWKAGDPRFRRRKRFVKYGLVPGFGFYDYGYLHLIGNHTKALTALWRLLIDAGMFSTFPGGLRLKGSRASTNEFRPGPGEFPEIDAAGVEDIRKLIMAMPYKEPSGVILEMIQLLAKDAAQIAGTVELELGEGRTNMPVGTILSMIEQQTQVMSAVHKRNHASQQEELLLLKELFAEDPAALSRFQASPARQWEDAAAFADLALVPASDPNVPAQVHRILQSTVLWMMASAAPGLFNQAEVVRRILRVINIGDGESLLNAAPPPPTPPPADPRAAALAAELPLKQQKLDLARQELMQQRVDSAREAAAQALEARERQQDRALKAAIEAAKLGHQREKLQAQQSDRAAPAERDAGGGVDPAPGAMIERSAGNADPLPGDPAEGSGGGAAAGPPETPALSRVSLPDGTEIINPLTHRPLVMPADVSLKANAAAGRKIFDEYSQTVEALNPADPDQYWRGSINAELLRGARMQQLFAAGHPMDYQRRRGSFDATMTPFSSYNYGLVARAAGYPLKEALFFAGLYNKETTGDKSGVYGNNPENVPLITLGWNQQPNFANSETAR